MIEMGEVAKRFRMIETRETQLDDCGNGQRIE